MAAKSAAKLFSQKPTVSILSVAQLVEVSIALQDRVHFRGQSNREWSLQPKIGRLSSIHHAGAPVPVHDLPLQEKLLLHRFRRYAYPHQGRILNEWETLFLARHHDLPVRLLDWSSNPLVALFFACEYARKDDNQDGAIYWFRRPPREMYVDVFDEKIAPFDYYGIQIVFPYYPTMRMTAQSGVFTLHSPAYWTDLRELTEAATKDKPRDGLLFDLSESGQWVIPKERKTALLKELERLGINSRVLFPELDGLVKGLMQTERFRTGEEYLVHTK
jgi:hypothetical protein